MSYATSWILAQPTKLSVFSVSSNNYLTMCTWDSAEDLRTVETNPSDLPPGPVTPSSAITAVQLKNWTRVFGWVTEKNSMDVDENRLYMLSPVNQWITKTATNVNHTSLTGISDGNNAWLYYADTKNKIREQPYNGIGSGNATGNLINQSMTLLDNTRLSACMHGTDRMIAYQPNSGGLEVCNITGGFSLDVGSAFPMEKTPIAMLSYDRGTDLTLDVYFLSMDKPPKLYRARKIGNAPKGPFATASLKSVGSPSSATTLTATRSVVTQKTILVFQTDDGNCTVIADEQQ